MCIRDRVTDPINGGTYNAIPNGESSLGHVLIDVVPWIVWGSAPEDGGDNTTPEYRLSLYKAGRDAKFGQSAPLNSLLTNCNCNADTNDFSLVTFGGLVTQPPPTEIVERDEEVEIQDQEASGQINEPAETTSVANNSSNAVSEPSPEVLAARKEREEKLIAYNLAQEQVRAAERARLAEIAEAERVAQEKKQIVVDRINASNQQRQNQRDEANRLRNTAQNLLSEASAKEQELDALIARRQLSENQLSELNADLLDIKSRMNSLEDVYKIKLHFDKRGLDTGDLPQDFQDALQLAADKLGYSSWQKLYILSGTYLENARSEADNIERLIYTAQNAPGLSSGCLLYTSPSPRDRTRSRMPSSA